MTDQEMQADQGDSPIHGLDEDRLGRRAFAEALAAEIQAAPASRGFVMGLTGPWGSGKTSILNMTVDALGDDALVVQFNPWMFSGTEALVASFFDEVGKQLERRESALKGIASKLATYGHLLSPLASLVGAGTAMSGAADVLEQLSSGPSVFEQREELRKLLHDIDRRLVVVVDDVDRLRPSEVLDIVRLVRLVGDFPNTLYLLAFDRGRVEECLGEGSPERGRAYLEKIVQVTHDVPAVRQPDVASLFLAGLEQLIEELPTGPFDAGDWQNIFAFVIRPLLDTPRSVRRLLGSLSMTMRLVDDEVALADLIGIEAVRVLRPAMFSAIVAVSDSLSPQGMTSPQSGYLRGQNVKDSPVAPMAEVDQSLATEICRWLFPSARRYFENMHHGPEWESTWRQHRKIGSAAVFRFYLERQLPEGVVPARTVDEALESLTDRERLRRGLDALSPAELMDLIERMNATLDTIPCTDRPEEDPARVGLPILLDLLPRLPEDTGMWSLSGSMVLMRAALRLLRRFPDEAAREQVIRGVSTDTQSFSARLILVRMAGHRKDIGSGLISAGVEAELEDDLRHRLCDRSGSQFGAQTRCLRLASFMAETEEGLEALRNLAEDDQVMLALLADSVGQTRSQAMGAAAVEVTRVLPWDQLIGYLQEERLLRRVAELRAAAVSQALVLSRDQEEALNLAADYAAGNRPLSSFERLTRSQQTEIPASEDQEEFEPGTDTAEGAGGDATSGSGDDAGDS